MAQLKLMALDADDLAVISAHVQDARVRTSDIVWRQGDKRLVVGMSRLDWEQTLSGETAPCRLIAALRFDRVLACKSRNIDLQAPDTALESARHRVSSRRGARRQRGAAVQPRRGAAARRRMPGMRVDRPRSRRSRNQRSAGRQSSGRGGLARPAPFAPATAPAPITTFACCCFGWRPALSTSNMVAIGPRGAWTRGFCPHPRVMRQGLTAICCRAIEQGAFRIKPPPESPMPVRLDRSRADFTEQFAGFLARKREVAADIESATRADRR